MIVCAMHIPFRLGCGSAKRRKCVENRAERRSTDGRVRVALWLCTHFLRCCSLSWLHQKLIRLRLNRCCSIFSFSIVDAVALNHCHSAASVQYTRTQAQSLVMCSVRSDACHLCVCQMWIHKQANDRQSSHSVFSWDENEVDFRCENVDNKFTAIFGWKRFQFFFWQFYCVNASARIVSNESVCRFVETKSKIVWDENSMCPPVPPSVFLFRIQKWKNPIRSASR